MVFLILALVNKLLKFELKAKHTFVVIFLYLKKTGMYRILVLHFTVKIHKSNIHEIIKKKL